VAEEDKNIAHSQTEVCSEVDMKSAAKTHYDPQLSPFDSLSLNGSTAITGKQNVIQSSMKSLKIIFPSTYQTKYEHMFLLEKIAFIYIELVVKRGYKAMTNWSFRNLAR
jgi:hypothetical protein